MVFKSEPLLMMPQTGLTRFIFSNPNSVSDDKPIFIEAESGNVITFGQLRNLSLRLNAGLRRHGFKKGDTLCIYSSNTIDYGVVVHGTIAAGGVVTTANAAYTADELLFQLQESNAKYLVTNDENLDKALEAAAKAELSQNNVFLFGNRTIKGVRPYTQVILANEEAEAEEYTFEEAKSTTAYLCFSSGTTGRSKGVMSSHLNIAANCVQIAQFMKPYLDYQTARFIGFLPFYHIYGLSCMLHLAPYWGIPVVVMPRFDLVKFCEAIQKYKVTIAHVVPPVLVLLAKEPIVDNYDLSSATHFQCGAAPLSAELSTAVNTRLNTKCVQSYGMTESSPGSHIQPLDDDEHGVIGKMLPGMSAKIVDDNGNEVGLGQRGELWMAGPNIMQGYLNMPEATAATIDSEGYLHTGDVATLDERGTFAIVDRVKELIKYKGFQVAPAELEALLLTCDKVADCAIIGVYDEQQATELPRAYIKVTEGIPQNEATVKELIRFVDSSVANHKKLRGGVRFLDVIPKSAAGKILRKELRVIANAEAQPKFNARL
ncbi:hypothetical protein BC943DRAFT_353418 [Umbelopsis sp. AD052]|nr:hypothetical protein BC943DRAFT_353418 [Umbelopsis sp. AD052]